MEHVSTLHVSRATDTDITDLADVAARTFPLACPPSATPDNIAAFIAENLDRKYDASSYARKFLEERLQQLKIKLEESEAQLVHQAEHDPLTDLFNRRGFSRILDAHLASGELDPGWQPDVLHAHDWHAAMACSVKVVLPEDSGP